MIRRFLISLSWVVFGLLVVAAVVGLFRRELAEDLLEQRLAGMGYPDARLRVTRLDLSGARIRDLSLDDGRLAARRIDVAYRFPDVIRGRFRSVTLSGGRLELDLTRRREAPALPVGAPGAGGPGLAGSLGSEAATPPRIRIRDSRVVIITGRGRIGSRVAGWVDPGAGSGRIEADIGRDPPFRAGSLVAELASTGAGEGGRLRVHGEADLSAPGWGALVAHPGHEGRLTFGVDLRGRIPRKLPGSSAPGRLLRFLEASNLKGKVSLALAEGSLGEGAAGVAARLRAGLAVEDGGLAFRLQEPATLSADRLRPAAFPALGRVPEWVSRLPAGGKLTLASPEPGPALAFRSRGQGIVGEGGVGLSLAGVEGSRLDADIRGSFRLRPDWGVAEFRADPVALSGRDLTVAGYTLARAGFAGTLSGSDRAWSGQGTLDLSAPSLATPTGTWRDLSLQGPLEVAWRESGVIEVRLGEAPARLTGRAPDMGPVTVEESVKVSLSGGLFRLSPGGGIDFSLRGQPGPMRIAVRPEGGSAVPVELRPGVVRLSGEGKTGGPPRMSLTLGDTLARMPGWGIEVRGLTASAAREDGGVTSLSLDLGSLRSTLEPPLFRPLTGELHVREEGQALKLSGGLGPSGRSRLVELEGEYRPDAGGWDLAAEAPAIAFNPDGLQPGALSPRLAELKRARGGIAAGIALGPSGGEGRIRFLELSFESPQVTVAGLTGSVALESLFPPATRAAQELSAQRVVAGLPLDAPEVRFSLEPGSGPLPALVIQRARAGLFGGQVRLEDQRIDPGAESPGVTLRVAGLDLGALFERLAVEGLSGSGRISGHVPIRLAGEQLVIDTGRLEAQGPGVLHYRSDAAGRALGEAGEQVRLMLRALEDFRYDELTVTLDRPAEGDLRLEVSLLGSNPDVLDGYPFRININISGDVDPIIQALIRGRELSGELLQRALELQTSQ